MKTTVVLYREALPCNWYSAYCCSTATQPWYPLLGKGMYLTDHASGGMGSELGFEFSASFGICLLYYIQLAETSQKIALNQFN